jgi:hypothetical protein
MAAMVTIFIKSTLKMANRFTPAILKRIGKSLLFSKKHFCRSIFKTQFTMPGELIGLQNCALLIGHSNFLTSSGGTERIIVEELENTLGENTNSVFIYPKGATEFLTLFRPKQYGLILNGFEICSLSSGQIQSFVKQILPKATLLKIHHLLFWSLSDILQTSTLFKANNKKIEVHLHDFYFHCPKVNAFCKSGNNQCKESYSTRTIKKWRKTYLHILSLADTIIAPSEYMKLQAPKEFALKTIVSQPAIPTSLKPKKLKLAFLGAPSPIKGYSTWANLSENALVTRKYELVHVGTMQNEDSRFSSIPYSYKNSKSCEASDILKNIEADLVLLWSQVPESYSFTFHEAINADKFIITSSKSGNIAYSISQNKVPGIVLDSDYQLIQFLLKKSQ